MLVTAHVMLVTAYVMLVTAHVMLVTAYGMLVITHDMLVTAHVMLVTPHIILAMSSLLTSLHTQHMYVVCSQQRPTRQERPPIISVDCLCLESVQLSRLLPPQDTGTELMPTDIKYYQEFGGEKVTYGATYVCRTEG